MPAVIKVLGAERIRECGLILAAEADGLKLRRELGRTFKALAAPIVDEEKSIISDLPSKGAGTFSRTPRESMREEITGGLAVRTRFSGRSAGVRIRSATTQLRGFTYASRKFNSKKWRHPFFGDREVWYDQTEAPGWFDVTPLKYVSEFRAAALAAVLAIEARVASRMRGTS